MKPNFALSLSFEGISLLHRTDRGWYLVGDVSPDAADMAAELGILRKTAKALDNRGFTTRLVLPNDQIRYLTLETGKVDDAARIQGARDALEGATPYDVSELAISASAQGALTHVAAVALETLQEAEAFANEHQFNPVCFVATPEEGDYLGEPFFGLTSFAATLPDAGASLGPAANPVRSSGIAPLPVDDIADDPAKAALTEADDTPPTDTNTADQDNDDLAKAAPSSAAAPEPSQAAPVPSFSSSRTAPDAAPASAAPTLSGASRLTISPVASEATEVVAPPAGRLRPEKPKVTPSADAGTGQPDGKPTRQSDKAKQAKQLAAASLNKAASSLGALRGQAQKVNAMRPAMPALRKAKTPPQQPEPQAQVSTDTLAPAGPDIGGKPRYLGLILTLVLLAFLVVVAIWASVFTDDGLAGLLRRGDKTPVVATAPIDTAPRPDITVTPPDTAVATVAPDQITDSSEVEAQAEPGVPSPLSQRETEAHYAVTGIWLMAPDAPRLPLSDNNDDLYIASIDSVISAQDAVAIPSAALALSDVHPRSLSAPAAAGTTFAFDARGLVVATQEGAVTPDGITVFKGRPSVTPPKFPERADDPAQIEKFITRLAAFRPRARPANLLENNERANNGGLTRRELAQIRPKARPATAKFELEKDQSATQQAVAISSKPRARPKGFDEIVKIARAEQQNNADTDTGSITRVAAAAPVIDSGPRIPTTASVARQATVKNAINLRKVNLIGVYGKPASRRALVRLANGRYKKVKVGDRIDGGKISAIGETELRYVKSGRNVVLKMPKT